MTKQITFFVPNAIGGVSTVVRNYLSYITGFDYALFVVKTCNTAQNRAEINFTFPNAITLDFYYSNFENATRVYKRLYKFLPEPDSIIIATDALELGMAHYLKLSNKIIFVVMGDFQHYYNLAITHRDIVDLYIAISDEIAGKLKELLPDKASRIIRSYYPVPEITNKNVVSEADVRVFFVGRFEESKGVLLIPKIDSYLKRNHISVNWTLVGDGALKQQIVDEIADIKNFNFMGFLTYRELIEEYKNHDIYLLPSKSEGLPISLIEAMKSGLVPIVSDISGGIREIVFDGVNGFLINPGNAEDFASALYNLDGNRGLLKRLRASALSYSLKKFNPQVNADAFFELISTVCSDTRPKSIESDFVLKNRLDHPFIPNNFVKVVRKTRSRL